MSFCTAFFTTCTRPFIFVSIFFFSPFFFSKQELPINIKFCFEGMEESGSEGLDDLIFSRKDSFLKDVDYVCISDNYWLGKTKPCITYGLRGICYFFIEVSNNPFLSTGIPQGLIAIHWEKGLTSLVCRVVFVYLPPP